jgi:hypothetical protein
VSKKIQGQKMATGLAWPDDRYLVVDTTAVPVVQFQRAHHAKLFRGQAAFGRRGRATTTGSSRLRPWPRPWPPVTTPVTN